MKTAFDELEDHVVHVHANDPNAKVAASQDGAVAHMVGKYEGNTEDYDFGLDITHSVSLARHTEYCQWSQFTTQECETCTRTNDEGDSEDYDCNCYETYHYVKQWRDHRINSLLFDQPANHHNPQRDPFPSRKLYSVNMVLNDFDVAPEIVSNFRGPERPLVFTQHGDAIPRDGFFQKMWDGIFGPPVTPRFEPIRQGLSGLVGSPAYMEKFVYTNDDKGWFFSAYESSTAEQLLRKFGQFVEGSLFDWQIGDLYDLYNGCTPGDIRVRYNVADPRDVSAIGKLTGTLSLVPLVARNGFKVGILHAGTHGSDAMFANETNEAHWLCKVARCLMLISGMCVVYLLNKVGATSLSVPHGGAGVALLTLAAVWASVYGLSDWNGSDSDAWTVAFAVLGAALVYTSSNARKGISKKYV
eukprot:g188.t1